MAFKIKTNTQFMKQIQTKVNEKIEKAIDSVVIEARSLAPVRTGTLRDSIERDGMKINMVDYGIFVEFGTTRMPAQPFLRPAVAKFAEYLKES